MIIDALRAASGRIAGKGGAAERLGLKRTTLAKQDSPLGNFEGELQSLVHSLSCQLSRPLVSQRSGPRGWLDKFCEGNVGQKSPIGCF